MSTERSRPCRASGAAITHESRSSVGVPSSQEQGFGASSGELNLTTLTAVEFDLFNAGYGSGYGAGVAAGRVQADLESAALHHRAFRVAQAAAKLPSLDELQERRKAVTPSWYTPQPWPEEQAPIQCGSRDACGHGPGVRLDSGYVTTGFPVEVVLTPAEQTWRGGRAL